MQSQFVLTLNNKTCTSVCNIYTIITESRVKTQCYQYCSTRLQLMTSGTGTRTATTTAAATTSTTTTFNFCSVGQIILHRGIYPYLPIATNAPRTILRKILLKFQQISAHKNPYNNSCQLSFFPLRIHQIDIGWGFAPDPLGSLQRSPRLPSWFQGERFAAGGERRGGKD